MRRALLPLLLLAAVPAAAEPTPPAGGGSAVIGTAERAERERIASEILKDSGSQEQLDRMVPVIIGAMLPELVKGNEGRDAEIRAILEEEFIAALKPATPVILEKARELYVERFTAAELSGMLAFNRSELGRKMQAQLPDIQLQMMQYGQQVGKAATAAALPRILDRLKAARMALPTSS